MSTTMKLLDLKYGRECAFDPAIFVASTWRPEHYTSVMTLPLVEMLGHTVVELAEEVVVMTHEHSWMSQHRRSVFQGDILHMGEITWLYINMEHAPIFAGAGMRVIQLPSWDKAGVVEITQTLPEEESACVTH